MEQRGGETGSIEEGAAADGDAAGMAADVARAEGRHHAADGGGGLLDLFTARQRQRRTHQLQVGRMGREIGADLLWQPGLGREHAAIQKHQAAAAAGAAAAGQGGVQRPVARREQPAGENNREGMTDNDALEMNSHDTDTAFRRALRFTPASRNPSA